MEAHGDGQESAVQVELRGLSIYTHHGVSDAEQEIGQRLVVDVSFDVPDCDAVLTDRLEDTIDYSEVADIVALAATERSYRTLERLGSVIGERLMERFGCSLGARPRGEARAADPAGGRGGRGRGRARAGRLGARRGGRARGRSVRRSGTVGYLGLGSNVGDRLGHLRAAVDGLAEHGVGVEAISSVYATEPVGEILDQPDFLNAAVRVTTDLDPEPLLDVCKAIEVEQGRMFGGPRHGPQAARRRPAAARVGRAAERAADAAASAGDRTPLRPRAPARARPGARASRRHEARRGAGRGWVRGSGWSGSGR